MSLTLSYGCETWSLISKMAHHRLTVFETEVMEKLCAPKWYEACLTLGFRKLHSQELYDIIKIPEREGQDRRRIGYKCDRRKLNSVQVLGRRVKERVSLKY